MSTNTAILLFANSSSHEQSLKKMAHAGRLFDKLNARVTQTVQESGLPYFLISENQQVGNTFGERYANAIEHVYNAGYDTVITIGNDTPELTVQDLIQASEQGSSISTVLGPSRDGGFYLLSIHKDTYEREAFLQFSWQTQTVRQELEQFLIAKSQIIFLEQKNDLDTLEHVFLLLKSKSGTDFQLLQLLQLILSAQTVNTYINDLLLSHTFISLHFNKGSPLAA